MPLDFPANPSTGQQATLSSAIYEYDGTKWVSVGSLFARGTFTAGTAALPGFSVSGDANTGLYAPAADQIAITTGGVERVEFGTTEVVFNDGGGDYDFRVEGDTEANLLFVDASTDRVGIGTNAPAQALHVVGQIVATDDITAFYSSDRRLKQDIEPIEDAVEKIKQINGVTYAWNDEYLKDKYIDGYFVRDREAGVIAQEIEEVLPEVVATRENGYKAVKYDRLVALLIQAVKEQQEQIDELKAKLEE